MQGGQGGRHPGGGSLASGVAPGARSAHSHSRTRIRTTVGFPWGPRREAALLCPGVYKCKHIECVCWGGVPLIRTGDYLARTPLALPCLPSEPWSLPWDPDPAELQDSSTGLPLEPSTPHTHTAVTGHLLMGRATRSPVIRPPPSHQH